MMITFSDGMRFDTAGELRVTRRSDGLYVTGQGMLIPVSTREEADQIIADMRLPKILREYEDLEPGSLRAAELIQQVARLKKITTEAAHVWLFEGTMS